MAIVLDCRIRRDASGLVIALSYDRVERAYMLLDALMSGALREVTFRGDGVLLVCTCGDADELAGNMLTLSEASVENIKAVLLQAALCPQEAEWLHADVAAEGGDVLIRVMNS